MHTTIKPQKETSPAMDADLLKACRKGDGYAFEQLLRRYEKPLFTFIKRMVGEREDAEDIFQDTLRRVVENIGTYDERGRFGSWLFSIAHRLCVDNSRRKKRWQFDRENQHIFADPAPLPDVLLEQKEQKDLLAQALQQLPPQQREIFLLRQHTGMTFREIADMVHRPLNTVLSQMRLAIHKIRACLQEKTQ